MPLTDIKIDFISYWREACLLVLAAALLTFYWYKGYHFNFKKRFKDRLGAHEYFEWMSHLWQFASAWALLIFAPCLYIKLIIHRPLSDFGVQWGRWGLGLGYVIFFGALMTLFLKRNARNPEFYNEYPLAHGLFGKSRAHMVAWELTYLMYYIPFEFFFRGFIQMGLTPAVGVTMAICFQMLPSVLIHYNKPIGETYAAVGGAFLMGLLIALTGSIIWPVLLHWHIGGMTDYFCWREWKRAKARGETVTEAMVFPRNPLAGS